MKNTMTNRERVWRTKENALYFSTFNSIFPLLFEQGNYFHLKLDSANYVVRALHQYGVLSQVKSMNVALYIKYQVWKAVTYFINFGPLDTQPCSIG